MAQWLSFEQERVMGGLGNPRFRIADRPASPAIESRLETGRGALAVLDAHLDGRSWVVGERVTIADLGLFPYVSVAGDAGIELAAYTHVAGWLNRVRALPGFADDFITYPENARPGAAHSIY